MRRIHSTHTRDAALRQLARLNRWMIAGSVVLTGVLADVAAHAFPGKTVKSAAASKKHAKPHRSSSHTSPGALRAPAQPPQAASENERSRESTASEPAQEATPQQSAPQESSSSSHSSEAAPEQAAPEREAPAQEAAPEPAPQESGPVVSGGS
jgi:hypothetical protein